MFVLRLIVFFKKNKKHFRQSEQRDKQEKENAQTLADEVDRAKMEVEQEKADLQVSIDTFFL